MDVRGNSLRWWLCAALVLAGSCGGATEENASCPLQAESCWNSAVAEAQACAPATTGVLASDNKTCLFDDGRLAVFDKPLTFPIAVTTDISVTLIDNTECAKLVLDGDIANVTLTTASGPHKIVTSLSGVALTCGGTTTTTKWSDCVVDGSFDTTGQPAVSFTAGGESEISLSFQGYFTDNLGFSSFASWFTCAKP